MLLPSHLFYAIIGGILPAALWLWFWLKEDAARPEPRGVILKLFFAGIAAVIIAFPLEKFVFGMALSGTMILVAWATIEEMLKLTAAYFWGLRTRFFDEPIDAAVYCITAALGFAAFENVLFIIKPLLDGETITGILTGNLRFVGATLLHVAASGTIGAFIGFSFYGSKVKKILFIILGITLAIVLHTLFNYFILKSESGYMFTILLFLWTAIIFLILVFEKIKKIKIKKQQI